MASTANTTQHTPTPWHVGDPKWFAKDGRYEIRSAACATTGKAPLAFVKGDKRLTGGDGAANAAHIVKCVNFHSQLVAALRDVTDALDAFGNLPDGMMHPSPWRERKAEEKIAAARAALAAAGA